MNSIVHVLTEHEVYCESFRNDSIAFLTSSTTCGFTLGYSVRPLSPTDETLVPSRGTETKWIRPKGKKRRRTYEQGRLWDLAWTGV